MEVDNIHSQSRKRWRIGNGRNNEVSKLGQRMDEPYHDEDDDDGEGEGGEDKGQLLAWHSSRIFRVSRASGGKDRHSKVVTAKGLRDRRVRLSVSTAIQFYDLQDRLGYDQPSKAVEWLIKKAEDAIAELPSLNGPFPPTPQQVSDEKRSETGFEPEGENESNCYQNQNQQQQHQLFSLTKSAGSSTSETSKGSVLSLSRSEIRVKARERARERAAKEKGKDKDRAKEKEKDSHLPQHNNPHANSQSSFTELLTGASNSCNSTIATPQQDPNSSLVNKQFRHLSSPAMDYLGHTILGPAVSKSQHASGFPGQTHYGNASLSTVPLNISTTAGEHSELHQFSFLPDHFIPVAASPPTGDYNLNFSISSSLSGFNRGTLQSNSQPLLPQIQRFPSPVDGPSVPFFIGPPGPDNQFPTGFDGRLHLYYGDGYRQTDVKGKGKS